MMTRLTEYRLLKGLVPTQKRKTFGFNDWAGRATLSRQTVSLYRPKLMEMGFVDRGIDRKYCLTEQGVGRFLDLKAEFEEGVQK